VTDQRLLLLLMMMMMVVTLLMVMCCSLFEEVQIDDGTRGLFRHTQQKKKLNSSRNVWLALFFTCQLILLRLLAKRARPMPQN
jgi:hypothetical protein